MALLVRDDGTCFVLRAYRERLVTTKRSLIMQRIRLLAEQHGQYARLYPSTTEQVLEIVFSPDKGYLLGDIVWEYFNRPQYLIFCERHQHDPAQIIVVVVRDGDIYLDTLLDAEELAGELLPLLTSAQPFRVITVGDVPISEVIQTGHFNLPKSLIGSFETLAEPILPKLPTLVEYELQPLAKILRSKLLGRQIAWPLIVPIIALLMLLIAWWFYPTPPEIVPIVQQEAVVVEDPFADFYQALTTPGPMSTINKLAMIITNVSLIQGWQASAFVYNGAQLQITLKRMGGIPDWLVNWAKQNNSSISITTTGAEMQVTPRLVPRAKPQHIYSIQRVVSLIDDKIEQIVGEDQFVVGEETPVGNAKKLTATINISNISPSLLMLIGQILGDDLPITIDNINLTQQDSNLLSGTIQLSVWGK